MKSILSLFKTTVLTLAIVVVSGLVGIQLSHAQAHETGHNINGGGHSFDNNTSSQAHEIGHNFGGSYGSLDRQTNVVEVGFRNSAGESFVAIIDLVEGATFEDDNGDGMIGAGDLMILHHGDSGNDNNNNHNHYAIRLQRAD